MPRKAKPTIGMSLSTLKSLPKSKQRELLYDLTERGNVTVHIENPVAQSHLDSWGQRADVRKKEGEINAFMSTVCEPCHTPQGYEPAIELGQFWGTEDQARQQVDQWATYDNGWKIA